MTPSSSLDLYSETAHAAAARILAAYSTSFNLATRLLPSVTRGMIRDIYALVRVADEIVDGPAQEAGFLPAECRRALDALEAETISALHGGFSANVVVHAFASTARTTGIDEELLRPFFASMRRDLEPVVSLAEDDFHTYVRGSAEAVGLMCLRAFLHGHPVPFAVLERLEDGARRLGAAFQKVNFLRDLADDEERLGRSYFPGAVPGLPDAVGIDDERKELIVKDIDADLAAARAVIPLLPPGARRATALAAGLFGELADRLRRTPAARLRDRRVSVPATVKLRLLAGALASTGGGAR